MDNKYLEDLKIEIMTSYNKNEEDANKIIDDLLTTFIKRVTLKMGDMSFKDLYKDYLSNNSNFSYKDFTTSEILNIIKETSLSDRDKEIARLRYIELKSEEDISYIIQVDKKTVHSNLPKISSELKRTCNKLYKIAL